MAQYLAIFDETTFHSYGIGKHAIHAIHADGEIFKPCTDRGNGWVPRDPVDLIDLLYLLAGHFGIDMNDPTMFEQILTHKCICPTKCDCQDPDNGFKSNSCPLHNSNPDPDPECLADLHDNNLNDHLMREYAQKFGLRCVFDSHINHKPYSSYIWQYEVKDETKRFSVMIGEGVIILNAVISNHSIFEATEFDLADPQLEDKLKAQIEKIRCCNEHI